MGGLRGIMGANVLQETRQSSPCQVHPLVRDEEFLAVFFVKNTWCCFCFTFFRLQELYTIQKWPFLSGNPDFIGFIGHGNAIEAIGLGNSLPIEIPKIVGL